MTEKRDKLAKSEEKEKKDEASLLTQDISKL